MSYEPPLLEQRRIDAIYVLAAHYGRIYDEALCVDDGTRERFGLQIAAGDEDVIVDLLGRRVSVNKYEALEAGLRLVEQSLALFERDRETFKRLAGGL